MGGIVRSSPCRVVLSSVSLVIRLSGYSLSLSLCLTCLSCRMHASFVLLVLFEVLVGMVLFTGTALDSWLGECCQPCFGRFSWIRPGGRPCSFVSYSVF